MDVTLDDGDAGLWNWSDLESPEGGQGGTALGWLVGHIMPPTASRALFVGPHDASVVDTLAEQAESVDIHLRARYDGRYLRRMLKTSHAGARVSVTRSGLDGLPASEYDAVIALDGWSRLHTPEDEPRSFDQMVESLAGCLGEGGVMVLGVPNDMGIDSLVRLPNEDSDWSDSTWVRPLSDEATRPATPTDVSERLSTRGLHSRVLALYPTFRRPSTIVVERTLREGDSSLVRHLFPAHRRVDVWDGLLADPRPLARQALRHGLAFDLAPGWVVLASADPARVEWSGPSVVSAELVPAPWTVVTSLEGSPMNRRRQLLTAGEAVRVGPLGRDVAALGGPIGDANVLEDQLLDLALTPDVPGLRAALSHYRTWLEEHANDSDQLEGPWVFATPDNVCVEPDGFGLLDGSWSWDEPTDLEIALVRGYRRVASRIVMSGLRHPWVSASSTAELTRRIGAMAGGSVTDAALSGAVGLEARIAVAIDGGGLADIRRLADTLDRTGLAPPDVIGLREARTALFRAQSDLGTLEAQAAELDAEIRRRRREAMRWRTQAIAGREDAQSEAGGNDRITATSRIRFAWQQLRQSR